MGKKEQVRQYITGLENAQWYLDNKIEQLQAEVERLKIKLELYEKDSAELLESHGVDPSDKIDREDLKRMLNYLIGKNKRLKEKNENLTIGIKKAVDFLKEGG